MNRAEGDYAPSTLNRYGMINRGGIRVLDKEAF